MKLRICGLVSCILLTNYTLIASASSARAEVPVQSTQLSNRAVFTDVAAAGNRLVAVGERGIVLISDDGAKSWRQVSTPVTSGLTAVRFLDIKEGWAIGHAGVVLHTTDGGDNWQLQLDGTQAAQIELASAKQSVDVANAQHLEEAQRRLETAQRLVDDGPDKPFLAMEFSDHLNGLVVGAFGLAMRTRDGGKTWSSAMGEIENPNGMHLYAVTHSGDEWYLGGEQGYFARSNNSGSSFTSHETPYAGTYFALAALPGGKVFIAGLKGNAFVSTDSGETFVALTNHVPATINRSLILGDGRVLMASQAGQVFITDSNKSLEPYGASLYAPLSGLAQTEDGKIVTAGFSGLKPLPKLQ